MSYTKIINLIFCFVCGLIGYFEADSTLTANNVRIGGDTPTEGVYKQ